MILSCGTWRSDGYAVGPAGAVVADGREAGPAADMDPAAADRRHTVADADRDAVAGCAERYGPWGRVYDLELLGDVLGAPPAYR